MSARLSRVGRLLAGQGFLLSTRTLQQGSPVPTEGPKQHQQSESGPSNLACPPERTSLLTQTQQGLVQLLSSVLVALNFLWFRHIQENFRLLLRPQTFSSFISLICFFLEIALNHWGKSRPSKNIKFRSQKNLSRQFFFPILNVPKPAAWIHSCTPQ